MKTHGYVRSVGTVFNGCGVIHMGDKVTKLSPSSNSRPNWVTTILATQTNREPTIAKIWHIYHVPPMIIDKFWQQLWKQQQARRITMFQWLLIHRSLPIGAWKLEILSYPNCVVCPNATDSIQQAQWNCPMTHQI